jgi:hypothetical protein
MSRIELAKDVETSDRIELMEHLSLDSSMSLGSTPVSPILTLEPMSERSPEQDGFER